MATASPVSPPSCPRVARDGAGVAGPELAATLISFFGQAGEAEGGIQNWEKEGKEEEKEKEGAAAAVLMAKGAPNPPGDLLSQRRKEAQDGGPQRVKLELHPLLNR